MTILFVRGAGTAVNIDSTVPKASQTNGTAARKFSAPDDSDKQQDREVFVKTNDEHLVEQAASMKGVSTMVDGVASSARDALAAARSQISLVPGESKSNSRPAFSSVTESDVSAQRNLLATQLATGFRSNLIDVGGTARDLHSLLPDRVFQIRNTKETPPAFNPVVPELASVAVEMDKRKGTVDCFYSRVTISIPQDQVRNGRVKVVRLFRSTVINPVFQRGIPTLSMHGVSRLVTSRNRFRSKNLDTISQLEHRYIEEGIVNAVTLLNPVDPSTNLRNSANSTPLVPTHVNPVPVSLTALSPAALAAQSFFVSPRLDNLDPSVASDLNTLRNIRTQDPAVAAVSLPAAAVINLAIARRTGLLNVSQAMNVRANPLPSLTVDGNNNQEFREIGTLTLDRLKGQVIGDQVEYETLDDQIGFAKAYRYYATTVDSDMIESSRSKIVEITVEGIRVPEMPKSVVARNVPGAIVLCTLVDDQLIEKFEVYRREDNRALIDSQTIRSTVLASPRGFNTENLIMRRLANGFIKVGESLNGTLNAGSMFYDRNIVPGRKYVYRVFSVDVFGNKSERPVQVSIYVPDGNRPNELIKPHLTAEVDSTTNLVRLTFSCTDPRVAGLFLGRKDLTIGQSAFTAPGGANILRFGKPKGGEGPISLEGEVLRGETTDVSWTGYFENDGSTTTFIDKSVSLDHTYQYRVYGVDAYGNRTSDEISRSLMVSRTPMIDAPVNLRGRVVPGPNFTVGGVQLFWQEGNITLAAEDYLGSQASLRDTSTRTLYQVERRKVGEELWVQFPLVPDLQFFDPSPSVLGNQTPAFRPPTVEANQAYVYRVQAVQTGSFISNFSDSIQVFASLPVLVPEKFRLRASDSNVKPAYIVLNWNTPSGSGVVDGWEIQRAVVNNVAAAKLNPKNSADFQNLNFSVYRTVTAESSRFRAQTVDPIRNTLVASATASPAFTGQHQFQDMSVTLGNTYFYRIRAVGLDSVPTAWTYRGLKLTDESFEKKLSTLLETDDRQALSSNPVPLIVKGLNPAASSTNTFALQPGFSVPSENPDVLIGSDGDTSKPGGGQVPQPRLQSTFQGSIVRSITGVTK